MIPHFYRKNTKKHPTSPPFSCYLKSNFCHIRPNRFPFFYKKNGLCRQKTRLIACYLGYRIIKQMQWVYNSTRLNSIQKPQCNSFFRSHLHSSARCFGQPRAVVGRLRRRRKSILYNLARFRTLRPQSGLWGSRRRNATLFSDHGKGLPFDSPFPWSE